MKVSKAYKVRLYPNKAQEAELFKIFAGVRLVWNHFLERRQNYFLEHKKTIPFRILSRELTALRKTTPELVGLQLLPLSQSLRNLDTTYNRFFRKLGGLPRFKHDEDVKKSFRKHKDWKIIGTRISIQKNLVVKTRGRLPKDVAKLGTLTIKYVAGYWYASIFVQEDVKVPKRYTKPIGIDVGLINLAVDSTGRKFAALKPSYDLHSKLKVLQQKISRQVIGSNRREETRKQIARLYHRTENIRTNHIHQTSHKLLEKNPSMIAIESLNVIGMMKNQHLSRSLADVSLGELHRQLKYKQVWNGGRVVEIDTFFPSTKTCSECGVINEKMTLATRNWTCVGCGAEHDRDINAAKNLLKQGQGMPSVEVATA